MTDTAALTDFVAREQLCLWDDLREALGRAVNGVWSMQAADVAARIGRAACLVGPTGPGAVSWTLAAGGVYGALLDVVRVTKPEYDWDAAEKVMVSYGGTRADLRRRMAGTVAALRADAGYIRDWVQP